MKKKIIFTTLLSTLFLATIPSAYAVKSHICASMDNVSRLEDRSAVTCTGMKDKIKLSDLLNNGYRVVSITSNNSVYSDRGSVTDTTRILFVIEK